MKLSNREKVLIFILVIVIIAYFGFKYLPTLDLFNLDELKQEYTIKSNEYNLMSQNIILKQKFEEDYENLFNEVNNLNVISNLQQEQLIVFLNNYLSNNNIDANNISFTDAAIVPMNHVADFSTSKELSSLDVLMSNINGSPVENKQNENIEGTENNTELNNLQPLLKVRSISVNISFESSYNNMVKFIDAIQNNFVDISITNINIVSSEGDLLQGTMTMNFYEVPKPAEFVESNEEWVWKDLAKSGKSNPFSLGGNGFVSGSTVEFDFSMSIMPDSSDLPAVIFGRTDDTDRSTYVYADSNSIENVNIEFKEENSKYFYRYSAGSSKHPEDGSWKEFTPLSTGNIYIKIYSSERNSKTDSVGVNIGLTNNTDLKPRVEISGDDKVNSRVYFRDAKSVIVTRK